MLYSLAEGRRRYIRALQALRSGRADGTRVRLVPFSYSHQQIPGRVGALKHLTWSCRLASVVMPIEGLKCVHITIGFGNNNNVPVRPVEAGYICPNIVTRANWIPANDGPQDTFEVTHVDGGVTVRRTDHDGGFN
eukprot:SAG11_NODE_15574_length_573_cov_1.200422_1_plen_134_part_10